MTVSAVPVAQSDLRQLVQLVLAGAEANERPDLIRRMRAAAATLAASSTGASTFGAAASGAAAAEAEVAAGVVRALESLEIDLRSRRTAVSDPGRGARLAAESRHAGSRLRRFQQDAAKWPRRLGDALSKKESDVEYAVQNRVRALLDEGTTVIESGRVRGDEFDRWLHDRLMAEFEACDRMLREAADTVAGRVGAALGPAVVAVPVTPPGELMSRLHRPPPAVPEREPVAARVLGIVMPTYGGLMIALVLPRILGLDLPVWLAVAAAVAGATAMGGSAIAGERQRRFSRRAAETVSHLRSTVDSFRMTVTKHERDGMRAAEQQLRASVEEAVEQRTRRLTAEADGSQDAAETYRDAERALRDIDADLASVRELQLRARQLAQRS